MRAIVIREAKGPEALKLEEDVPEPRAGVGEVVIRVHAVGVNHALDRLVALGAFGQLRASRWETSSAIQMPLTPGADVAGVVEEVGAGVTSVKPGDRVVSAFLVTCGECRHCRAGLENSCVRLGIIGVHRNGGAAELVSVPAGNIRHIPDYLTYAEVTTIPVSFSVAWDMMVRVAGVDARDWVLVMAAGSGLGSAALQIAKLYGARVIAAAGSNWKLERARKLGADETLNYSEGPLGDQIREITNGHGVDLMFDGGINQETWDNCIEGIAHSGRIVFAGTVGGDGFLKLNIRHFYRHNFSLLGNQGTTMKSFNEVVDQFEAKRLKAVIHAELPLGQVQEAHRILEERQAFGKIVLNPRMN